MTQPLSVFSPGRAKPAAAGSDDDAGGEPEDEDDALDVPSFRSSAPSQSVVVELGRYRGSQHGGVGPGAEDNAVPGFGGGGSEVPRLGSGEGGFGG